MQDHVHLTQKEINRDLLAGVLGMPKWWIGSVAFLLLVIMTGLGAYGYEVNKGIGVSGLNRPVMWGFYITNFVFWIGISHAGIMISAILRLSQAEWRRPVTRAAEVMTIFSLMAALSNIMFHVGRPWRLYWIYPYDFSRGIWMNIRSPFVGDPSAVMTYLIASTLFVFVALLPDLAIVRDRATGKYAPKIYGMLCMGWRGTPRQWKLQAVAGILLSALVLPVFVSVHSIVSWDFAIAIGVEGWHSTIFAPYFIIGAIHSGVSAVAMIMALAVWLWKLDNYLRPDHFDAIGRLLIVVATTWFFFFFIEWVFALYTLESPEIALREFQVFQSPMKWLFIFFLLTAFFIPVPLWMFRRFRRNFTLMLWTSLMVNVGMFLERFLIIVPGLMRKGPMTFDYATYRPSIIEFTIIFGAVALVSFLLLMFSKFFPLIPLWEVKEGQLLADEVRVGNRMIPGLVKE